MRKGFFLILGVCSISISNAQIGINTQDPKATLDIVAISGTTNIVGLLPPRLTRAELTAKGNALYSSDQKGTIVYITDISGGDNLNQRINIQNTGYYYFDGSLWIELGVDNLNLTEIGDIKYSFGTTDHDGWYLLNGRTLSTFPSSIQTAASSLGFTANLPDARDRVLKSKTGSEALGSTAGANTRTLSVANLPTINLSEVVTSTSESAGAHSHAMKGNSANGGAAHSHTTTWTQGAGGTAHNHTFSGAAVGAGGAAHTHSYSGTATVGPDYTQESYSPHGHAYITPRRYGNVTFGGKSSGARINYAGAVDSYQSRRTADGGNHNHTYASTAIIAASTHTHGVNGASDSGTHTHTFPTISSTNAVHTHTFSGTSDSQGKHSHTVDGTFNIITPVAGSFTNEAPYLVTNTFVYLGN